MRPISTLTFGGTSYSHLQLLYRRLDEVGHTCPLPSRGKPGENLRDPARYLKVLTERDSVSAYCLAIKYLYNDIVKAAARSCLKLPITKLKKSDVRYCITLEEYEALIEYHTSCSATASAATLGKNRFLTGRSYAPCSACTKEDRLHDLTLPRLPNVSPPGCAQKCLWSYLHRSGLPAHHPSVEEITKPEFVFQKLNCHHCSHNRRADFLDFSQLLATDVQKAIEKVIGVQQSLASSNSLIINNSLFLAC
jgi:hypothetical protein